MSRINWSNQHENNNNRWDKFDLLLLFFLVPPSRLRLTSSTSSPVLAGTLVSFHCISERVYPNPIFEWYKNDKLIQRFVFRQLFDEKKTTALYFFLSSFVSSIGNQTDSLLFSSSSLLTLLLTPADHNNILRCQVSNEASVEETRIEVKLDILCEQFVYRDKRENFPFFFS